MATGIVAFLLLVGLVAIYLQTSALSSADSGTATIDDVEQIEGNVVVSMSTDVEVLGYWYFIWDYNKKAFVSPTGAYHKLSEGENITISNLLYGRYSVIVIGWTGTQWTSWSKWYDFKVREYVVRTTEKRSTRTTRSTTPPTYVAPPPPPPPVAPPPPAPPANTPPACAWEDTGNTRDTNTCPTTTTTSTQPQKEQECGRTTPTCTGECTGGVERGDTRWVDVGSATSTTCTGGQTCNSGVCSTPVFPSPVLRATYLRSTKNNALQHEITVRWNKIDETGVVYDVYWCLVPSGQSSCEIEKEHLRTRIQTQADEPAYTTTTDIIGGRIYKFEVRAIVYTFVDGIGTETKKSSANIYVATIPSLPIPSQCVSSIGAGASCVVSQSTPAKNWYFCGSTLDGDSQSSFACPRTEPVSKTTLKWTSGACTGVGTTITHNGATLCQKTHRAQFIDVGAGNSCLSGQRDVVENLGIVNGVQFVTEDWCYQEIIT